MDFGYNFWDDELTDYNDPDSETNNIEEDELYD